MQSHLPTLITKGLYLARPWLGPAIDSLAGSLINQRKKHYIKPELTVAEFFQHLEDRQVRYVVLRWFEQLPQVERGHDIDLLIADEHVDRLVDLLTYWPVGQPIDLYSVSGAPSYDYSPWFVEGPERHAMALFPPHLSRCILERAVVRDGLFRVPSKQDHFLSLAYHAAYLKGPYSGLRSRAQPQRQPASSSHDYAAALKELATGAGLRLPHPPTFEDLDDLLARHGWRPPPDTLERLALWSPWLQSRIYHGATAAPEGLVVFFIRQQAVDDGLGQILIRGLELRGFEILLVRDLDADERAWLTRATRGGNWGPGPYSRSGGLPACAVAALDVFPAAPAAPEPCAAPPDNDRVQTTKVLVRRWVSSAQPLADQYNPLHSTDNKRQAWDIVRRLAPHQASSISVRARASIQGFNANPPGIKDLTRFGNRSRVELIDWHGQLAVRKTFKPHCGAFLRREAQALTALARSTYVPQLLETGHNYVVIEYLEDAWSGRVPLFLPLRLVRQLADFMKFCASAGYDPIDLLPRNNVILDRRSDLKVIDFEFCLKQPKGLIPESSYCLSGIPADFSDDFPFAIDYVFNPYAKEWKGYTGLSLHSFLYAAPWRQRVERAINYPGIVLKWMITPWAIEKVRRTSLGHLLWHLRRRLWGPPGSGRRAGL